MSDERERCPRCGVAMHVIREWTNPNGDQVFESRSHRVDGDECIANQMDNLRWQLAGARERLNAALAREAELRRVVEAAIAARDAFRLYDDPEKWHKAIAKLARVVEDLDPKLVVALDREEGWWRGVTQRQAERNLAVAAEQVLKAWDMGDDVSDAIEELREAALDYAAVEAGEPEFEVEVVEIEDQLEAGAPRLKREFGRKEGRGCDS